MGYWYCDTRNIYYNFSIEVSWLFLLESNITVERQRRRSSKSETFTNCIKGRYNSSVSLDLK